MSPLVQLRPVQTDDLPALFEHQADPASVNMAVVFPRDAEAFAAHWTKILADPSVIARAVIADDELAGSASCFEMDGLRSVGYWIAREHWGRGIATRAVALLLAEIPKRPLHARVARSNAASIRVLEKNGFVVTAYRVSPADGRFPECEEAILVLL